MTMRIELWTVRRVEKSLDPWTPEMRSEKQRPEEWPCCFVVFFPTREFPETSFQRGAPTEDREWNALWRDRKIVSSL